MTITWYSRIIYLQFLRYYLIRKSNICISKYCFLFLENGTIRVLIEFIHRLSHIHLRFTISRSLWMRLVKSLSHQYFIVCVLPTLWAFSGYTYIYYLILCIFFSKSFVWNLCLRNELIAKLVHFCTGLWYRVSCVMWFGLVETPCQPHSLVPYSQKKSVIIAWCLAKLTVLLWLLSFLVQWY